ncbi:hypothetical protein EVAR_74475_1 [Eumeta japonica]|uniref:Uncharacterized protein n=1 Tax=Eumeta variegata TaxID=151549 RepID=A0A4C1TBC3_EUMVA|nr:hypothetical protein EVAR_74475_1 [Eumeta japonica]
MAPWGRPGSREGVDTDFSSRQPRSAPRYRHLSLAIVYNWFNYLRRDDTNLTDHLTQGCPSTATIKDIGATQLMTGNCRRVT